MVEWAEHVHERTLVSILDPDLVIRKDYSPGIHGIFNGSGMTIEKQLHDSKNKFVID